MKYQYEVGGMTVELETDDNLLAVRFAEPAKHSTREKVSKQCGMSAFRNRIEVPKEKFTILQVGQTAQPAATRREKTEQSLENVNEVTRVSRVFKRGNNHVIATDRVLLGLTSESVDPTSLLNKYQLISLEQAGSELLVELPADKDPLLLCNHLQQEDDVDYAEPDFVTVGKHVSPSLSRQTGPANTDPRAGEQYAIEITKARQAWQLQQGSPDITIAILDEGVDSDHKDLAASIQGTFDGVDNDTFQEPNPWDAHGTACAGLAAAIHNNTKGIKGIAGGCSIFGIRIAYSARPGDGWTARNSWIVRAIDWAWQNGADVLSNSWGGGSPSTAINNAFERARTQGRNGLGCVSVVAAGNDSGPVSYPGSLPTVLTVSASNEYDEFKTKTSRDGENWWGSNFGPEIDIAAPGVHNLTTDIAGESGYSAGDYADFNGTSSATPIVAGAAALVLSAEPELGEEEVRERLKNTADQVGAQPYQNGRNDQFGDGRLNVLAALQLSQPPTQSYRAIHQAIKTVAIKDNTTSQLSIDAGNDQAIKDIRVSVDITHTYEGDLVIELIPPHDGSPSPIVLQNSVGGDEDDLRKTFTSEHIPELKALRGQVLKGVWQLEVTDTASQDEGHINSFSVELVYE